MRRRTNLRLSQHYFASHYCRRLINYRCSTRHIPQQGFEDERLTCMSRRLWKPWTASLSSRTWSEISAPRCWRISFFLPLNVHPYSVKGQFISCREHWCSRWSASSSRGNSCRLQPLGQAIGKRLQVSVCDGCSCISILFWQNWQITGRRGQSEVMCCSMKRSCNQIAWHTIYHEINVSILW